MDSLKKIWPTPFKIKKGDLKSFLIQLIVFVVVCAVIGVLIGVLAKIPVVGIVAWIAGLVVEVYSIVGIVLCILKFFGIV